MRSLTTCFRFLTTCFRFLTTCFRFSLQAHVPDVPGASLRTRPARRLHAHDGLRARGRQEIQIQVRACVCVCVCAFLSWDGNKWGLGVKGDEFRKLAFFCLFPVHDHVFPVLTTVSTRHRGWWRGRRILRCRGGSTCTRTPPPRARSG